MVDFKNLFRRRPEPVSDYKIGDVTVALPQGHDLPLFQKKFPQYDRLLPHLATHLPDGSLVIDVGANVGDTVAGMIGNNRNLAYLCIEGDGLFFEYLSENVERIKRHYECEIDIRLTNSLIGKNVRLKALSGNNRTKQGIQASDDETVLPVFELDDIYQLHASELPVSLIKVDVDGFDYDVLASATAILRSQRPILYFECDFKSEQQYQSYVASIRSLDAAGYDRFAVFDNYGGVIVSECGFGTALQILRYLDNQFGGGSARTMYYVDILAWQTTHDQCVRLAIADHEQCA